MDGLIIIDKPRGPSSFDVVRRVRQVAGTRRVGHTGTLDPDASGVLGVAIGKCTKLAQFLTFERKEYEFEAIFGVRTDSDDALGEVVEEASTAHLNAPAIEAALPPYVGAIQQVPPTFSAIHVDGKRAYELARKGVEFELEARTVEVYSLDLVDYDSASGVARMRVECGSGTYVRSLARDLGHSLGTVAHARGIRRVAVGPFRVERAVALEKLDEESLAAHMLSPAEMVGRLPHCVLEPARCHCIGMGQRVIVALEEIDSDTELELIEPVAVLDESGALVAVTIVEAFEESGYRLKPRRVLQPTDGPGSRGPS